MPRVNLLLFCLLMVSLRADPTAQTVKIFTEIAAQNRSMFSTLGVQREKTQISRIYTQGSAWAVELDGHPYLVTAAHVIGLLNRPSPDAIQEVKNGAPVTRTKLEWPNPPSELAYVVRVGIGDFGAPVKTVGQFSADSSRNDVVLLEPAQGRVLAELRPTKLASSAPKVGDQVQALGLPDTPVQQNESSTVTAVFEPQGYFVLNTALKGGYSGGLVLNKEGLAIGVVTSTNSGQTTVILVNGSRLKGAVFKSAESVFSLHPEVFAGVK